ADEVAFRDAARRGIALALPPQDVTFVDAVEPSLFPPLPDGKAQRSFSVPRAYNELLHDVICHSAADRFALLYDVLYRTVRGERGLASNAADPSVARLNDYAHSVRRDI